MQVGLAAFKDFAPRLRPDIAVGRGSQREVGTPTKLVVIDWANGNDFAPQLRPTRVLSPPSPPRSVRADPFSHIGIKDFAPRLRPVWREPQVLDPKWHLRAACRGEGSTPDGIARWFPGPGGAQEPGKKFCRSCPVVVECGDYADRNKIEWGIWGGEIRHRKTSDGTR